MHTFQPDTSAAFPGSVWLLTYIDQVDLEHRVKVSLQTLNQAYHRWSGQDQDIRPLCARGADRVQIIRPSIGIWVDQLRLSSLDMEDSAYMRKTGREWYSGSTTSCWGQRCPHEGTDLAHLFSSSAIKKAMNSTRLQPGVITRQRTLRAQNLDRRRSIGNGFKKKTATKTSQAAGHLRGQLSSD